MSSFAKKLGFKKEKESKTTPQIAIGELKKMEELFTKKQEHLELKIKSELETAKKHGAANRRLALQALRRKKRYEQQLQQIDGTMAAIEMQREALESASTNTSILATMKQASDALKQAQNKMNVDDVQNIIDDIAEQQVLAKEIADAISSPLDRSSDLDEDDLLKELEELEQEELDKQLLKTIPPSLRNTPSVSLPVPPTATLPTTSRRSQANTEEMDDDLLTLQEWAS